MARNRSTLTQPAGSTAASPVARQSSEQVQRVLEQATYFVVFSVPDPQSLSKPTLLLPFVSPQAFPTIYEIAITEAPRRLQITVPPPTPESGLRTVKRISQRQVADQTLSMSVAPNNFQSGPGRLPPPTLLLPFLSQRFWMYNGHFAFRDGLGTGFRAIAGGRFFPAGSQEVWIGGAAEIVQGLGQLQGFVGNLAICGLTAPPADFWNAFLFRFVDPTGELTAPALPPVVSQEPDPDTSDSALIPLAADLEPGSPVTIEPVPGNGNLQRIGLTERLRLVDTNFDVGPGLLKAHKVLGPVVGTRRTTLVFDPTSTTDTIPMFSTGSEFTFYADGDKQIGTLQVDLAEARCFPTSSQQLQQPFFRFVGFGPLGAGSGQFTGAEGMLVVNGALSLSPPALSSMYLLRIRDQLHQFQRQLESD